MFLSDEMLGFVKEFWKGLFQIIQKSILEKEGKCACERHSWAVDKGFVKLSNRWLWICEWQLLGIPLHWIVVIPAASAILSWLPMEISLSVFVCGHWFDAVHMGEEVIWLYSQFTIIHGWILPISHAGGVERSRPEPPKPSFTIAGTVPRACAYAALRASAGLKIVLLYFQFMWPSW